VICLYTSVKISEDDKKKLEKLQALLTIEGEGKASQQSILSAIIDYAYNGREELLRRLSDIKLPLSDDEFEGLLSLVDDWGVETRAEEIDRYLYGLSRAEKR